MSFNSVQLVKVSRGRVKNKENYNLSLFFIKIYINVLSYKKIFRELQNLIREVT